MSEDNMGEIKRNKVKMTVTVSKRVKDKVSEYGEDNISNFVENSIMYYLGALEKEKELKLKEARDELKQKSEAENELIKTILQLVSNHPELLDEYNEMRRKAPSDHEYIKKVRFE